MDLERLTCLLYCGLRYASLFCIFWIPFLMVCFVYVSSMLVLPFFVYESTHAKSSYVTDDAKPALQPPIYESGNSRTMLAEDMLICLR